MKVSVLGSGLMGHGIGEVFAIYGNYVTLYDIYPEALKKATINVIDSLEKLKQKGKVDNIDEVMKRINTTLNIADISDSDLVIEAVPENLELKSMILLQASTIVREDCVLASNTSSLPVSELSRYVRRPERFLGLHFFNPPVLMRLVEVVKGNETSEKIFNQGIEIAKSIGKIPIPVRKDVIGFVVNRILFRVFTSACSLLGKYTVEEIDSSAKYLLGFPMGIFELLDYTGIDTNYLISLEVKKRGFNYTCPALEELYKKGNLGSKSDKGFYDWRSGRPKI
ncbi:3-hydroxyacyl-CoA dehydrogenase family protein, partial [Acidianus sp. RZ1]|uniref:3-hydroxyacyl-CoA dehydrogenase family protein n=1 Tax=Acidianus sp. RZ1 TaxID=1540082 RepID=UPI0020A2535A